MHICIVTPKYPTNTDPTALTFVQQLAWEMADLGEDITVICPIALNRNIEYWKIKRQVVEYTNKGNKIDLFFPKFIDFGQIDILNFNTSPITSLFFKQAVDGILKKMSLKPNVLYGHFMAPAGVTCAILGKKYGLPSFAAYGESSPWTIYQLGIERTKKYLDGISGIISVSSANKEELVETGVVERELVGVFPNGYRPDRFFPKDKNIARAKFGFQQNEFIVAFVGHFIKRKGIDVLLEAINQLDNVHLICAGKGPIRPVGEKVLFADLVSPDQLVDFYSCADVFVLPTKNEGCCNAIIEAMACGLPIISSNLPFNNDILDNSNSIRINPNDANELAEAIDKVKTDSAFRKSLAEGSCKKAKELTLEVRAKNIISFIQNKTTTCSGV